MLWSVSCVAMDGHCNEAKSFSPGPTRDQISRHARQRSLSGKVLDLLHLRTDEINPVGTPRAVVVSDRPSHHEAKESPKKSKSAKRLTLSSSNTVSPRKLENNRDAYVKDQGLAYASIRKITSAADAPEIMKSKQYINSARFFYKECMRAQFPNLEESWVELMADDEFKSLQEEYATKIASLTVPK